jgi:hypothetical protein
MRSVTEGMMTGCIQIINLRNVLVATMPVPVLELNGWGRTNCSNSTNTERDNPYLLPGCDGRPKELLRSYDIVSLGCLCMDLLEWSTEGKSDYRTFLQKISTTPVFPNATFYYNEAVKGLVGILSGSQNNNSRWEGIKRLLYMTPMERPTAAEVVGGLR